MTTRDRRWDNDSIGAGTRDASIARPDVERLLATLSQERWVAEAPEEHLLPQLAAAAARSGLELERAETVDGVLEVDLRSAPASRRDLRGAVFTLIGAIAEASTHVRESNGTFEVVTGMLSGDGEFAPHGHLVRIRIAED